MLAYLPQLLDGLMNMLSDPNREIRVAAEGSMTVGREPEREGWGGMRQGGEGRAILRIDSFELFKSRCWAALPLPVCRVCNSPSRFLWGSTQYPLPTLPHPIFPHLFPHSGVSDGDPHHAHHRLQRPLAHPRGQELQPGVGGGGGRRSEGRGRMCGEVWCGLSTSPFPRLPPSTSAAPPLRPAPLPSASGRAHAPDGAALAEELCGDGSFTACGTVPRHPGCSAHQHQHQQQGRAAGEGAGRAKKGHRH